MKKNCIILILLSIIIILAGSLIKTKKAAQVHSLPASPESSIINIQSMKELKKNNDELYKQVKALQKQKIQPILVSQVKTELKIDTIFTEKAQDSIIINDSMRILKWRVNENPYYSFDGSTSIKTDFSDFNTKITNFKMKTDLSINLVEKDKKLNFIIHSSNPYVNINEVNSTVIDPTKSKALKSCFPTKRWHIGPYVGFGVDKNLNLTPSVGVSLGYGIINF